MPEKRKISLVLADVDGTLVTEEKVLTQAGAERRQGAAQCRHPLRHHQRSAAARHGHAVRRARARYADRRLQWRAFRRADLTILAQKTVPADVARQALDLIREHGLDAWVYCGNDWLITKPGAPHVAREAWTVKFEPKVVPDFDDVLDRVAKIVGVSDDLDRVRRCEADAQAAFGQRATANRSQPYYLDVTNKDANKGAVVEYLSHHMDVPPEEIATIGDQPNDVLMFKRSGFSIAMGNASDEVKAQASAVPDSYNDEGFAKAMERFILGSIG